ncbi:MAG TPA: hypothetical protein VE775_06460 [Pyrinomonadaceae bacterium]|nr:hypothetical protein [Pyrinomonadaceae bacterium]
MPDDPIVVSGGSVTIDFNDSLQRQLIAPQGKQVYHGPGRLLYIMVNEVRVVELEEKDVVKIYYQTD